MEYQLEQFVRKIESPVVCRIDDKELYFKSGEELAHHKFDRKYDIYTIQIHDNKVLLLLREQSSPQINSVGEELVATLNWIEDHKNTYGKEPNLFDGA